MSCQPEYACLVATTRHLNQANIIITYLHRKLEQRAADRRGEGYGTKNQSGNASQQPIIGYIPATGAAIHEILSR